MVRVLTPRVVIVALFAAMFLVSASAGAVALPGATSLSGTMTVDNVFTAYLSTDDSVEGTVIGSGNSWPVQDVIGGTLTAGVTNYLHIKASDLGPPAMFIGEFTLSDNGFAFANGGQSLLTDTVHWQVSVVGFGTNYQVPADLGADGTSPWGFFSDIDNAARFIWEPALCGNCTVYFSTAIVPTVVPVPAMALPFAFALAGLGVRQRRTRRSPD